MQTIPLNPAFLNVAVETFVRKLEVRLNEYKTRMKLTYFDRYEVIYKPKIKFIGVYASEIYPDGRLESGNGRIIAFIELATGNVLKPAGYNVPAKHARGNVFSSDNGMEAITDQGHVAYLR